MAIKVQGCLVGTCLGKMLPLPCSSSSATRQETARGTSQNSAALQSAELKLVTKERRSLRKSWSDVALIGNRASEKCLLVSFAEKPNHLHSHNKTVFHKAVHIQGKQSARRVLLALNIRCPEQDRDIDEQ